MVNKKSCKINVVYKAILQLQAAERNCSASARSPTPGISPPSGLKVDPSPGCGTGPPRGCGWNQWWPSNSPALRCQPVSRCTNKPSSQNNGWRCQGLPSNLLKCPWLWWSSDLSHGDQMDGSRLRDLRRHSCSPRTKISEIGSFWRSKYHLWPVCRASRALEGSWPLQRPWCHRWAWAMSELPQGDIGDTGRFSMVTQCYTSLIQKSTFTQTVYQTLGLSPKHFKSWHGMTSCETIQMIHNMIPNVSESIYRYLSIYIYTNISQTYL